MYVARARSSTMHCVRYIRCHRTRTNPGVVHAPGTYNNYTGIRNSLWESIIRRWQRDSESDQIAHKPSNLTILTFNTSCEKSILETSLDRLQIEYAVLGKAETDWCNRKKIDYLHQALSTIQTEYVMCCDAFDVLVLDMSQRCITALQESQCDLLFNGGRAFYPKSVQRNEGHLLNEWERFEKSVAHGPFCFLNAGVWIGRTAFCRRFFQDAHTRDVRTLIDQGLLPARIQGSRPIGESEQVIMHWMFREYYPAVRVDSRAKIFINLSAVSNLWILRRIVPRWRRLRRITKRIFVRILRKVR